MDTVPSKSTVHFSPRSSKKSLSELICSWSVWFTQSILFWVVHKPQIWIPIQSKNNAFLYLKSSPKVWLTALSPFCILFLESLLRVTLSSPMSQMAPYSLHSALLRERGAIGDAALISCLSEQNPELTYTTVQKMWGHLEIKITSNWSEIQCRHC